MEKPIVHMKDVSFVYDNKIALDHIDFDIHERDFIGLVGPNGGGKTTLVKLILGLLKPNKGNIELFQKPLPQFKEWSKIGFVSQKANSFNRGFPATVQEVVSMGLAAKAGYFKFLNKKHKEKVIEAVSQVDMLDYLHANIGDLSGGQQQRIFIARALVSDPKLLILDEPTVGVDTEHVQKFYELLHHLNEKENITLLLVTHDTGTMTHHATDIACLNKRLHFHGPPADYNSLSERELSSFYGHSLNVVTHHH